MQANQSEVAAVTVTAQEQVILIPLSQLRRSKKINVRTAGRNISKAELKASLLALGVLQNLVVVPIEGAKPTFDVAAGGRRYAALVELAKEKKISADYPVPCKVRSASEATTLSLTENFQREPMNAADEFLAFQKLISEGKTVQDICVMFGVSAQTVHKRLKLADVDPMFIRLYRNEEVSFDILMALTLTDDKKVQRNVWTNLPEYNRTARAVRHAITHQDLPSDNPLAVFIGADAYEAAGGVIRRDLFSDDDESTWTDSALVTALAQSQLDLIAESYVAAGWGWAQAADLSLDVSLMWEMQRLPQVEPVSVREASAAEATLVVETTRTLESLQVTLEAEQDWEREQELQAEADRLEVRLQELAKDLDVYAAEQISGAGVYVHLTEYGAVQTVRGIIRPPLEEDDHEAFASTFTSSVKPEARAKAIHSDKLMQMLTANRTAAMQAVMTQKPELGLVVLAHRLYTALNCIGYDQSAVCISVENSSYKLTEADQAIKASVAGACMQEAHAKWAGLIPNDRDEAFAWMISQPQAVIVDLLAYCTAKSVNAISGNESSTLGHDLARYTSLEMNDWWEPTADCYFSHVTKATMVDVITTQISEAEAKPLAAMKKPDAAARAAALLKGKGWLPQPLSRA